MGRNLWLLFILGKLNWSLTLPLLQNIEGVSSKQVVGLTPDQEASGHPLGPASLVLSPHNIWLSSVGRDGLVRIRETAAMVVEAASFKYSPPPAPPPPSVGFSFTLLLPPPGATHRAAVPLVPRRWSEDRVVLRRQPGAPHHRLQRRLRCVPVYQVSSARMSLRYCDEQQRELLLPETTLKKMTTRVFTK